MAVQGNLIASDPNTTRQYVASVVRVVIAGTLLVVFSIPGFLYLYSYRRRAHQTTTIVILCVGTFTATASRYTGTRRATDLRLR